MVIFIFFKEISKKFRFYCLLEVGVEAKGNEGTSSNESRTIAYQNIMEVLIEEEIEKQLQRYPITLIEDVNKVEIATYALNRLPPLYASSEKGKHKQKLLAQKKFRTKIKSAVRNGLAAVQRDPCRSSTALMSETELRYQKAQAALQQLQDLLEEWDLLDRQDLSWENLVSIIQRILNKLAWSGMKEPLHLKSSKKAK